MKKVLYLASTVVLVTSFSIAGGRSYAAHQSVMYPVRLCSSAPIGVPGDAHIVQGIFNGVRFAVSKWRARFRAAGMVLQSPHLLDDAKADGSAVDAAKEAQNAHTCIDDPSDFGYVGTLNSSMAQVSEPILNRAGMVMISPANSNPVLTDPRQRSTYEPLTASGRLRFPTYYRVVTTDALQGPTGALYMAHNLGVKTVYVVDDGQTYGVGLAQHMVAFNTRAGLGMKVVGTGRVDTSSASAIQSTSTSIAQSIAAKHPDAVYCGCDEPNSYPLERAARRDGYSGWYVGGDAIFDSTWAHFVGGAANARNTVCTFIGLPESMTASGFRAAYHRAFPNFTPGPYDALAYDAANIELQAIFKAFKAGKLSRGNLFQRRASVLPYVAHVKWYGANGITTFDKNGDTKNRVLDVFKEVNGNWTFVELFRNLPKYLKPTG